MYLYVTKLSLGHVVSSQNVILYLIFSYFTAIVQKMDNQSIQLSCRFCGKDRRKPFTIQSIVQHAIKSKCPFSEEQISDLRTQSKSVSDAKKKAKMAERYQRNKAQISRKNQIEKIKDPDKYEKKREDKARRYQSNKASLAIKYQTEKIEHPDQYEKKRKDKAKRYQSKKHELMLKYQKRKVESTNNSRKNDKIKQYQKEQRAIKYNREMRMIKQKREEMKKNKESEAGQHFKWEVLNPILKKVHNTMVDDHFEIAYAEVMENEETYCDQAFEAVFEEQLWSKNFELRMYIDCEWSNNHNIKKESHPCEYWTEMHKKPCIHHITQSQLDEAIFTAMEDSFAKEKDRIIQKAVKDVFEMEWEHAMNKYSDGKPGNGTFDSVSERTINKAFATVFKEKYINIYENAYDNALDKFMLSDNSARVWQHEDVRDYYNKEFDCINHDAFLSEGHMSHEFNKLLTQELEASEKLVHDEIVEMIEEEFYRAFLKKWYNFKSDIRKKMLSCNGTRCEWALKKLREIERTFQRPHNRWEDEEMTEFKKETLFQISKIYTKYDSDIKNADKLNSVEMDQYFCFTNYIKTYPTLDFMNKYRSYGPDRNEMINFKDDYGCLIENLWLQLALETQKCACDRCTYIEYTDYFCKIDCKKEHTHEYVLNIGVNPEKDCQKIRRQRFLKKPYRTCIFCQNNIPAEEFEQIESSYHHTFAPLHMKHCAKNHGFMELP